MRLATVSIALILAGCGSGSSNSDEEFIIKSEPPPTSFSWEVVEPSSEGVDGTKLNKALDYAFDERFNTQAVLVSRNGKIIAENYSGISGSTIEGLSQVFSEVQGWGSDLTKLDYEERFGARDQFSLVTSWSTAKSVSATLIGIAIKEGFIESVEQPVSEYLPAWSNTDKENTVSIKDLLQMKSRLACPPGPNGGAIYFDENQLQVSTERNFRSITDEDPWLYCNADSMLLGEIILNASGHNISEFGDRYLFSKLDMQADWWRDSSDNYLAYCCIDTTTRDFARFGLFWLNDGIWNEERLINQSYIQETLSSSATAFEQENLGYGYQWYVQSVFEDDEGKAEAQSYGTKGYHLNNIWIFPELELLVVRNSLYRRILEVTDDTVRTGDLTALLQGENTPVNVHHTLQQGNAINVNGIWYTYNSERGIEFLQESKFIRLILASMDQT